MIAAHVPLSGSSVNLERTATKTPPPAATSPPSGPASQIMNGAESRGARQSESVAGVAPDGQHESPAALAVTGVWVHCAPQVPPPASVSAVQGSPSSHAA